MVLFGIIHSILEVETNAKIKRIFISNYDTMSIFQRYYDPQDVFSCRVEINIGVQVRKD